jgi:hypothetical protein
MKGNDPYADDVYRPPDGTSAAGEGTGIGSPNWLGRWLRVLILVVLVVAAVAVLYWMVQVFICDLRETVFRGMSRRAAWLCW